jgi:hypothetical protein
VPAFLAVMAVVGYLAMAGLPWWAVVAVVLLTAGLAGWTGSHKAAPTGQPVRSSADTCSTVLPVPVNVRGTGEEWAAEVEVALESAAAAGPRPRRADRLPEYQVR